MVEVVQAGRDLESKESFPDYLKETPNFISVLIFSLFFNMASLMLIDMSRSTGIETTNLGLIFTFYTIGAVVGQMTSILYNRRFSRLKIILSGYIILILLLIILILNSNLIVFYMLYMVSGYLLGVLWIQANGYILENKIRNKDRVVTVLLSFYPIGALVAPIISSSIIRAGLSWRFSYYVIIFLILVNMVLYIFILGKRKISLNSGVHDSTEDRIGYKEIFIDRKKNILFILTFVVIIFYCCSETVVATWAPTFFRQVRNIDIQSAGLALTIFWLFILVGRVITMFLAGRVRSSAIMLTISILAVAAGFSLLFMDSRFLILIVIAITGLGYSAMFPLLISSGSTIYEKGRSVLATLLFISSNIGITAAPFLTKFISRISMVFSFGIAAVLMSVVVFLVGSVYFISLKQKL